MRCSMTFWNRKPRWEKPFPEKLAKRVTKIPSDQLLSWADQAMFEISRCISEYEKNRDEIYLIEALNGAEALHAVINESYRRNVV